MTFFNLFALSSAGERGRARAIPQPSMASRVLIPLLACVASAGASPAGAQPTAADVISAVVEVHALIPGDARTATSLGTQRSGAGVVIDDDGLVLTIGYLILEAATVTVGVADTLTPAAVVAYDHATGFGLVRARGPLHRSPLALGDSSGLRRGDPALVIGGSESQPVAPVRVVDRRDFAGYWEYLLEDAIFTAPPQSSFAGAALVDLRGRLVGVGSLMLQDAANGDAPLPGNMFVPINALKPILPDLLARGRGPGPSRPWLGMFTRSVSGHLFVTAVAPAGPAEQAGVRPGDIVLQVAGERITGMADFFRRVWALGNAGARVPLRVLRDAEIREITIESGDRYRWLRLRPGATASARAARAQRGTPTAPSRPSRVVGGPDRWRAS